MLYVSYFWSCQGENGFYLHNKLNLQLSCVQNTNRQKFNSKTAMGYIRTPERNKLHDDKIIAGVE